MRIAGALVLLVGAASLQAAEPPASEELLELVRQQQSQIASLQAQLDTQRQALESLQQKVEATTRATDAANQKAEILAESLEQRPAVAQSANTIGGYGELHLNTWDSQRGGEDKKELDFHRFVLFYGHRFNDRLRFDSEVEIEHTLAGDGEPGAVELEQAYIEYDWAEGHSLRAGQFLLPVGFLNETHEPPTFYGVERNPVESRIIPTTWWEGGVELTGSLADGLRYDFAVHSGLNASAEEDYAIRDGRQEVAKARFDSEAYTGRLRWLAVPGLELAATVQYQRDVAQESDPAAGDAWFYSGQLGWQYGNFGLRALYARWSLDGAGPEAVGADRQDGWYVEPSWRLTDRWGVFARYSRWDNRAGDSADTEHAQTDVGLNFWLHPQVVFKLDYRNEDAPDGAPEFDGWNLGFGYQF